MNEQTLGGDLGHLRTSIERQYGYRYKDEPLHNRANFEWHFLIAVPAEQMTVEHVASYLRAEEAWLRESVNREMAKESTNPFVQAEFRHWSRVDDAVRGLDGRTSIDRTISYLREEAGNWEEMAGEARGRAIKGGPYDKSDGVLSIVDKIKLDREHATIWKNISKQLDTAARLVENQPRL